MLSRAYYPSGYFCCGFSNFNVVAGWGYREELQDERDVDAMSIN
jgi:hypothetical protein